MPNAPWKRAGGASRSRRSICGRRTRGRARWGAGDHPRVRGAPTGAPDGEASAAVAQGYRDERADSPTALPASRIESVKNPVIGSRRPRAETCGLAGTVGKISFNGHGPGSPVQINGKTTWGRHGQGVLT